MGKSVSNCSAMKVFLIFTLLVILSHQGHAKSVESDSMLMRGLDRSEIEAAAERNLAIIKAMFNIANRALLGDPNFIMAFIPKLTTALTGHIAWWLNQVLVADPFATPGP